ncbi:unnamed protein product [Meganyctiphanes norvegica]|uniref:Uncharacterized protein n=1 Tax=Meganyctiphanes norvegica TaxID=48144 RepID=A0AAV2SLU7_MEGNR
MQTCCHMFIHILHTYLYTMQYPPPCTSDCDTQERYIKKNEIKKKCFYYSISFFYNTHKEKNLFSKMYYCYTIFISNLIIYTNLNITISIIIIIFIFVKIRLQVKFP